MCLVLTDVDYLALPGVSVNTFIPPAHPGGLVIPPAATDVQAIQARKTHKKTCGITENVRTSRKHYIELTSSELVLQNTFCQRGLLL